MLHCEKCGVDVAGNRSRCPLCQNHLTGEPTPEVFPVVPTIYHQFRLLFQILLFASIVIGVAAVAVNLVLPETGAWSLFVIGGLACLWLSMCIAIRKRKNIPKSMLYQVVFLSAICVIWDFATSWGGWSIDYVIPILCSCSLIAMSVLSIVLKWEVENILIYFCISALFAIIPLIFFLAGWLTVPYPSVICVALGVLCMAALAIFESGSIWAELKRRLHM